MTTPRPLWRWWLFCAALSLWWRFRWEWLARLYPWCVLPEWLGAGENCTPDVGAEVPW